MRTNWEIIKLGDAATFVNGFPFKPSDWSSEGLEIIRIQNLTKGSSEVNYFQGSIHDKYKVRSGDLLISWSATLGIYEWQGEDSWVNQHIFKVIFDKKEFNKSFFKHLISASLEKLGEEVHGATMKHITKTRFDEFKIPYPPIEAQNKIADILDSADTLSKKTHQIIESYDELAQSIFLDMFGDPVTNPKGWEKKKLGSITNISSGSTPSRENESYYIGNIPWVKTTELRGIVINDSLEKISEEALKNTSCRLYPIGTILIAMYGQGVTRGKVGMLGIEAATNQACAALPPSKKMDFNYLFNHLKISYSELRDLGRGGNQPNMNSGLVKEFMVLNPPLIFQIQFVNKIKMIEQQIELAKQSFKESEDLFNTLLKKAFKGELNIEN